MPMTRPAEVTTVHTKLLKCTLEIEDSRSYWARANGTEPLTAKQAFEDFVFGSRSLQRLEELLPRLRARFDAFPPALAVLHEWSAMPPETRRLICHWHVQLSDPLYRRFTGSYLPDRRESARPTLTHDQVVKWVGQESGDRWGASTRIQFASKLLSTAHAAGLVQGTRDPRPLGLPSVPSEALEYLLYLLRGIEYAGTLLDNPYIASVGLVGWFLADRLRALPSVTHLRQGDLVDLQWRYPDLRSWADHAVVSTAQQQLVEHGVGG